MITTKDTVPKQKKLSNQIDCEAILKRVEQEGGVEKREILEKVLYALNLNSQFKSHSHLTALQDYFESEDHKFIQQFSKYEINNLSEFFRLLRGINYPAGTEVIDYGDIGQYFYIIIEGRVQIMLPVLVQIELTNKNLLKNLKMRKSATIKISLDSVLEVHQPGPQKDVVDNEVAIEVLTYSILYYKSIAWKVMQADLQYQDYERIKVEECPVAEELHEFMLLNPDLEGKTDVVLKQMLTKIQNENTKNDFPLPIKLYFFFKDFSKIHGRDNTLCARIFTSIKQLGKGEFFGELALINNQRRAAKVVCMEDTMFGTLQKREYNQIVGNHLKQQMERKVQFLRNFRIFKHLSDHKI